MNPHYGYRKGKWNEWKQKYSFTLGDRPANAPDDYGLETAGNYFWYISGAPRSRTFRQSTDFCAVALLRIDSVIIPLEMNGNVREVTIFFLCLVMKTFIYIVNMTSLASKSICTGDEDKYWFILSSKNINKHFDRTININYTVVIV